MQLDGDIRACLFSTVLMLLWVEAVKILAHFRLLLNWQRRKVLHIFTGPIFLLTWSLFSYSTKGAFYAALVPGIMTLKFLLIGLGLFPDEDTVLSASRSGKRQELLRGPLFYGIIFTRTTYWYWKGIRAVLCLLILCFGDGFAEIFGKQFGQRHKLPWSPKKSYAGCIGFVLCSTGSIILFLSLFRDQLFPSHPQHFSDGIHRMSASMDVFYQEAEEVRDFFPLLIRILINCVMAALVESLPIDDFDNVTVFLAAILTDTFFLRSSHHHHV